jgi:hypothetical protein
VAAAIGLVVAGGFGPVSVVLGVLGLLAILRGANDANRLWQGVLAAAVFWTVAWALGSG